MRTLHLAAGSGTGREAGTSNDPVRIGSAREFDDVLRTTTPTRFVLGPGVYETRGAWAFPEQGHSNLSPECELIGAGSRATLIRLAADPEIRVNGQDAIYLEALIAGSIKGPSKHVRLEGFQIECTATLPSSGLHVFSSDAIIRDVLVTGARGVYGGVEGFGILVNNAGVASHDGGHLVENCTVEDRFEANYLTAIYVGCEERSVPIRTSIVQGCRAHSVKAPPNRKSHAGYGLNSHLTVRNCECSGFLRAFFNDTGSARGVLIDGVQAEAGYAFMALHANESGWERRNIRVTNSTIRLSGCDLDHVVMLVLGDFSPAHNKAVFENVRFDGCDVVDQSNGKTFYIVSINGTNTKNIGMRGCNVPAQVNTVFAPPSLAAAWSVA